MKPQLRIFALAVIFILLVPMIMLPAAVQRRQRKKQPSRQPSLKQAAEAESTEAEAIFGL